MTEFDRSTLKKVEAIVNPWGTFPTQVELCDRAALVATNCVFTNTNDESRHEASVLGVGRRVNIKLEDCRIGPSHGDGRRPTVEKLRFRLPRGHS